MTIMMNTINVIQSIETNHQRNKMVETKINILIGCFWVFICDIQSFILTQNQRQRRVKEKGRAGNEE
jgi:hypothetical protein